MGNNAADKTSRIGSSKETEILDVIGNNISAGATDTTVYMESTGVDVNNT